MINIFSTGKKRNMKGSLRALLGRVNNALDYTPRRNKEAKYRSYSEGDWRVSLGRPLTWQMEGEGGREVEFLSFFHHLCKVPQMLMRFCDL